MLLQIVQKGRMSCQTRKGEIMTKGQQRPERFLAPTAYGKEASYNYDKRRFSSPHGKLFDKLELEHLHRISRQLIGQKTALEIGCGTGRFIKFLLSAGHKVYGLDPSPYMLKQSVKKTSEFEHVAYVLGEGAFIPIQDNTFSFVYCIRTINQLPSREYAFRMIQEMIRVCGQQGLILLEFINSWGIHRKKSVRISVRDIRILLKQYPSVKLVNTAGILFFSQRIMNMVPIFLLEVFERADKFFASLLPQFCTRCYVTLKVERKEE